MPFQTAVFGIAWWTTFREKRSARACGIAASIGYLAMALFPLAFPPHSFFSPLSPVLALGIVGVLAFSWPAVTSDAMPRAPLSPISGDGTSSFLNQGLQLFAMLAYFGAYKWWIRWLERNDLSAPDFLTGTLMLIVVGLVIVTLHECGHALVGLILRHEIACVPGGAVAVAHSRRQMGISLRAQTNSRELGCHGGCTKRSRFS